MLDALVLLLVESVNKLRGANASTLIKSERVSVWMSISTTREESGVGIFFFFLVFFVTLREGVRERCNTEASRKRKDRDRVKKEEAIWNEKCTALLRSLSN